MAPDGKTARKITSEEVGVLKAMKIALEFKKFEEDLKAKGKTQYSASEFYEKVIAPVQKL